jgi:hypothetical protein
LNRNIQIENTKETYLVINCTMETYSQAHCASTEINEARETGAPGIWKKGEMTILL